MCVEAMQKPLTMVLEELKSHVTEANAEEQSPGIHTEFGATVVTAITILGINKQFYSKSVGSVSTSEF